MRYVTIENRSHMNNVSDSSRRFQRTAAAMAITVAICAGCAVGPDFKRAPAPDITSFTREPMTATASARVEGGAEQRFVLGREVAQQWWMAFGSPKLDALIQEAFEHSPTIEAANAALVQTRENAAGQFGLFLPVVQGSYSLSRQQNAVGTLAPTLNAGDPFYTIHTAQLSIAYAPDVFGLNRRTYESLKAQADAQRFQLEAAYLTLASNVVGAAVQEAALRAQIAATEEIITALTRSVDLLNKQSQLGAASGLDVAAQATALAQAQQTLPGLRKQLEQTRNLLAVLTGRFPTQADTTLFDLEALQLPRELPLSVPSKLVEHRPDVRAAEAQVHAASAAVGIAVANRLPQFSITALLGGVGLQFNQMFSDGNKFWGVTGSVAQTIFDFGTLKHRQRATEAALEQAKAQYRSVVLTAFQNVADSLYALDADAKALAAAVTAEAAAKKTFDITRGQFEAGAINGLTLLTAQQLYIQVRVARVQAQAARYADTAALFQALGGGWWQRADAMDADGAQRLIVEPRTRRP